MHPLYDEIGLIVYFWHYPICPKICKGQKVIQVMVYHQNVQILYIGGGGGGGTRGTKKRCIHMHACDVFSPVYEVLLVFQKGGRGS